jgi:hypothetical protein
LSVFAVIFSRIAVAIESPGGTVRLDLGGAHQWR